MNPTDISLIVKKYLLSNSIKPYYFLKRRQHPPGIVFFKSLLHSHMYNNNFIESNINNCTEIKVRALTNKDYVDHCEMNFCIGVIGIPYKNKSLSDETKPDLKCFG